MWVLSAYNHPMILLGTNWFENHKSNLKATIPPIKKGECIFHENSFENLKVEDVYEKIISYGVTSENLIDKFVNSF